MIEKSLSDLKPKVAIIYRLCVRDIPLQLLALFIVCLLCWHAGHKWVAINTFTLMCFSELMLVRTVKSYARDLRKVHNRQLITILLISCFNAVAYTAPGLFLATSPSTALMMVGILWIMGVHMHITHTWPRFPVFAITKSLPVLAMMFLAVALAAFTDHVGSPPSQWWFGALLLVLYGYSSWQMLDRHASVEKALSETQNSANERLQELELLHRTDPLTGLLNRSAFDDALGAMIANRDAGEGTPAVFLIDLDSFKPINDTYSHDAGDAVLLETAARLSAFFRENGVIGRLGGDEFICALPNVADRVTANRLALKLQRHLGEPIRWQHRQLTINASIGIALAKMLQKPTISALCSAADQAMFRAKSLPSGQPVLFDPAVFAPRMSALDRRWLADAVTNGSIRPYYQPKVYLPTGEIIGFEALARWEHPDRGILAPQQFLDQINELGLQGHMLNRMASMVVSDIQTLLSNGHDPGQVSLNVPEVALATQTGRNELVEILRGAPEVRPHLTIEITEDVFIARAAEAIQASISAFRSMGLRISLDDFGTGFASFHHLRQLEFDELKIDLSFVQELGQDPATEVLVQGFLAIASGLGVSVIAEGVETEAQRRDLLNLGCITAQGYHFAKALPFEAAQELLAENRVLLKPSATGQPLDVPIARDAT